MIPKILAAAVAVGVIAAPVAAFAQTPSPKARHDTIKNDKLTPDAKKHRAGETRSGTVGSANNPNNAGGVGANSNGGPSGEGAPGGAASPGSGPGGATK